MLLTIEEARAYARDDTSDDAEISALIEVAESTIEDACGADFDRTDPKAKMLAKLIVADLTDGRDLSGKESGAGRALVQSMMLQLRTKTVVEAAKGGG